MTTEAVVAGAGIAGLTAGLALARRGVKVTVFERSKDPREFGAGIYLKENSLPVLEQLGVLDKVIANGVPLKAARIVDERGEVIVNRRFTEERMITVLRRELHNSLREAAVDAGVELVTDKMVVAAKPEGVLVFADGSQVRADLVIGADGVRSRVRESLGLTKSYRTMEDGATRLLIPRQEEPMGTEYWAGNKRIGVAPCSPDQTYVFMIGPEQDRQLRRLPVDTEYWSTFFPQLGHVFDRITDDAGVHHVHEHVVCKRWVDGRVAMIGDAAHAQPPNLGQGAGLAMVAAWELARTVAESRDVPSALLDWERRVRPAADRVQKLTTLYSHTGYYWPAPLLGARAKFFHFLSVVPVTSQAWEFWWRGGTYAPAPRSNAITGPETD
ncbi:FAD-dependent monooxygenase [Planosporangium flavigriseum]|uniref:Monooxygenase n=1 Tax=Planosporangium flavigriseum TaxID=373681 RepID=A0A8J3LHN1_9ACTN|nr:NAD(P)/FAD-dependent oxidoreductase [Planosporangium flavigriseum]NJC62992.1 FAD-dependent monooxygenase [Planosporangium flavigriseum]GIG73137.1 monooxygenase [Planosporangium flavigriseum]